MNVLKAFLLAAGNGTRLRPLTDHTPKCLLPIGGTPMLEIWLQLCASFGINEVLVNIHSHAEKVREFVAGRCAAPSVDVVEERELLGSAGTLLVNRKWVDADPMFWVFYADVLHRTNLAQMCNMQAARKPVATLAVYRVPDPGRCGIVTVDTELKVMEFVEKPQKPKSNLAFAGIMIATPELLDFIPSKRPADIGFDVLPRLAGRMLAFEVSDYLIDIGTVENYEQAQNTWPGPTN